MDKRALAGITVFWLAFVLNGCARVEVYSSSPAVQRVSNSYFDAALEPQLEEGRNFFTSFRFAFTNKTKQDLSIDWENSYYVLNNVKKGRFLWEGVNWDGLKEVKGQPLILVSAGDTFSKVIFPASLVGRSGLGGPSKLGVQYTRGILPAGENGILLVARQNGEEIKEKISVNIEVRED